LESSANSQSPVLLLVEDEVLIRYPAAEYFRDHEFRVLEAGNAREALIYLQTRSMHINVMISDVKMPGDMDGIQLADWTRDHCPHVRILLVSGWSGRTIADHGHELIEKPYVFDQLLAKVRKALARE